MLVLVLVKNAVEVHLVALNQPKNLTTLAGLIEILSFG